MIEFVFLDLDDTIFDFLCCERLALSKALKVFHIDPTEAILSAYSAINLSQWKLLEQGKITREELSVRRFSILAERFGLSFSPADMTVCYDKNLAESCVPAEGANDVLSVLAERYSLYAATNGSAHIQHSRMARSGFAPYFKAVFISEEIGANKPEAAFFERCFDTIQGFDCRRAVMVGDSLSSDIRGGKNAGLQTIWLCHESQGSSGVVPADYRPDYTIHRLSALPPLLEKL